MPATENNISVGLEFYVCCVCTFCLVYCVRIVARKPKKKNNNKNFLN